MSSVATGNHSAYYGSTLNLHEIHFLIYRSLHLFPISVLLSISELCSILLILRGVLSSLLTPCINYTQYPWGGYAVPMSHILSTCESYPHITDILVDSKTLPNCILYLIRYTEVYAILACLWNKCRCQNYRCIFCNENFIEPGGA